MFEKRLLCGECQTVKTYRTYRFVLRPSYHAACLRVEPRGCHRLGVHAFHSVLSCKPLAYQAILGKLEFDMRLPQYRRAKLRTKKVVKEGQEIIGTLSF